MRNRDRYKTAFIAGVGLGVASAPWWGIQFFLYVCGGVLAVVGLVLLGGFLEFWLDFRRFDRWTLDQARMAQQWRQRRRRNLRAIK